MNRLGIVAALVLVACNPSSGGGSDGTGGPGGGAGECGESFAEVVPMQTLGGAAIYRQIIVDGSTLYLRSDSHIISVPAAGGALLVLYGKLGSDSTIADAMWVDAQTIWFQSGMTFQSVPKSGGSPTMIGQDPTMGQSIVSSAHDADGFFYIRQLFSATGQSYTIATVSAQGAQKDIAPIGDKPAKQIFADGGYLYWFQGNVGQTAIYRMPKPGGSPQKIADADPGLYALGNAAGGALAFDDTSVYYSSLPDSSARSYLMKIAKDGSGQPARIGDFGADELVEQTGSVWGIGNVRLSDATISPAVWRSAGGTTVALACTKDSRTVHALAVDPANAYVAITNGDANQSGLFKVAR